MVKRTKEKHTLERFADGMLWTERLLELFWAVDEVVKENGEGWVSPEIFKAYENAERARKEL